MIAVLDEKRGLGREGQLLWRLPGDMRRFQALTWGRTLVLGRVTLESFPGGLPLPGRRQLILSRQPRPQLSGGTWVSGLAELATVLAPDECAFVAGGASVYQQLAPYCRRAWLTQVATPAAADCFFPPLAAAGWRLRQQGPWQQDGAYITRFQLWENPAPLTLTAGRTD